MAIVGLALQGLIIIGFVFCGIWYLSKENTSTPEKKPDKILYHFRPLNDRILRKPGTG